ncbi:MAG: PBP1A family penicillin-binding protein [Gammaproteobacteria bacterium]|nr:PBP1A family penicillin-binding protein [Gammaproteobacteria bacterium]
MQFVPRWGTAVAALAFTIFLFVASVAAGVYYFLAPGLPSANTIRAVPLQTPLRVYSRDGRLMAQLGEQRRMPVRFEEIPDVVVKSFLAAEDDRFFDHPGFDWQGILRAGLNFLVTGERTQGGSTITQQLARAYFLTPERSFVRKAKELFLAVQIEQTFSKPEILALYLNKIFLGQRAYGVAAAAEVYFGKTLAELNVAEAATIAAIPKAPSQLNPVSGPARAMQRRAYVLGRMRALGYIDQAQFEAAVATPLQARLHGPKVEIEAPYIAEMVRAEMVRRFGDGAYTDGFTVVTTVDSRLQHAANTALATALYEYDRRHGFRGPRERGLLDGIGPAPGPARNQALEALLTKQPGNEDLRPAVVLALGKDDSASFYVREVGEVTVPWSGLKWRRFQTDDAVGPAPRNVAEQLAVGDLVFLLKTVNRGWLLAQVPEVEGAFTALDPADGATVALTGGFDFYSGSFNRAVQARRQPGSSFKPFVYSAGLDSGFTPASIINDAPLVFGDADMEDTWRPENYSREFSGPTRMREALVKSLNLVSVRILMGTGIEAATRHIRAFGFDNEALPPNLSLALGSGGASPWDVAAGYAVFANGGRRVEHYFIDRIVDSGGRTVFQAEPFRACRSCERSAPVGGVSQGSADARVFAVESGTLQQGSPLDSAPPPPASVDEVPDYGSVQEMLAHGESWRPGIAEAPAFFRSVRLGMRVISEENAFMMYDMMRDVIERGTGRRARELGRRDIAGKTGTSNERRDAWFSGFNGALVATAWVGFDQERSLGDREEGGQTALPMWKSFMARALRSTPETPLRQPAGLVAARIVPATGQLAGAGDPSAVFEYFRLSDIEVMNAAAADEAASGGVFQADEAVELF